MGIIRKVNFPYKKLSQPAGKSGRLLKEKLEPSLYSPESSQVAKTLLQKNKAIIIIKIKRVIFQIFLPKRVLTTSLIIL